MVSWVSLLLLLIALSHYSLGQGDGSETETTIEWKASKDDGIHAYTAETSVPNDKETTPQRTGTDNDRVDTEATTQKIAPSYEEVTVETSTGS
ncbi:hypothetical protein BgiBS90_025270 [Biomphalaria glabrata]|nr:hypothetical protein BgiBS90_025270 [Biomphalaria glabrata]